MATFNSALRRLLVSALLLTTGISAQATTYYVKHYDGDPWVKQGGTTFGVGEDAAANLAALAATSWETAIGDLQAVINVAVDGDIIFVAAGTYKPVRSAWPGSSSVSLINNGLDRENAFLLKTGVKIYGGFVGIDEASIDDREFAVVNGIETPVHPTILSGELQNDGIQTNNAHHVVLANSINNSVLDGFTISDGYGTNSLNRAVVGAGLYIDNSTLTATHLTIRKNTATDGGTGAGICVEGASNVTLTQSTIQENTSDGDGGGIAVTGGSNAAVTATYIIVSGNKTTGRSGGGIGIGGGTFNLSNSLVSGNTANTNGGGLQNAGTTTLTNVTVAGNYAINGGGWAGDMILRNTIVWGNSAPANPNVNGTYTPYNSLVEGKNDTANNSLDGTDAANTPPFRNPVKATAGKPTTAGDYRLVPGSNFLLEDRGNNGYNTVSVDLEGNTRIQGCAIDLGAYENASSIAPDMQGIVHVKKGATGNGSSWNNAYPELANVLLKAKITPGCITEIWVAEGTFYPLYTTNGSTDPRDKSFDLVSNIKVYGGFAGYETHIDDRKLNEHETILSGELQGDSNDSNNARHIVTASAVNNAQLDGFTITRGYADGTANTGGGIYSANSSVNLVRLNIRANTATGNGGGIWISGSPALTDILVSGNVANGEGGGIYNQGAVTFINVTVAGNKTGLSTGGIYNSGSSNTLKNSIIWGNSGRATNGGTDNYNNLIQGSGGSVNWKTAFGADSGNNLDVDPLFVNPSDAISAPTALGDYRLQTCSPAIDAGDESFIPAGISTDLDGRLRDDGLADMGAYEFYTAGKVKRPTATPSVTGVKAIVLGDGVDLYALTGTAPWEVTYNYTDNKGNSQVKTSSGIQTSPFRFVPEETGTYRFTLLSVENAVCKTDIPGSPEIIVIVSENLGLKATATVTTGTVCVSSPFDFNIATTNKDGSAVTPDSYIAALISGTDILNGYAIVDGVNQPVAAKAGAAIYSVTPVYNNVQGIPAVVSLEARALLTANHISNLTYENGDQVPVIDLTANLPANTVITWTADNTAIGISANGSGYIPAFNAVNTGTGNVSATINYTVAYADGQGCSATGSFTITVTPKTNVDSDLVASTDADASDIACLGDVFQTINFSATDKKGHTGNIEYRIEFVSGVNVAGTVPPASTAASWTPTANVVGTGIYRVVPVVDNREGVAALFTLESRASLAGNHINDLVYENKDQVPTINLTGNLPTNTIVTWTANDPGKIGISASGTGVIPAFNAVNTGTGNVSATINYTVAYADGKGCSVTGSFTITVTPKTNVDSDLIAETDADAGEITCLGDVFTPVNFSVTDKKGHTGDVEYRIEFVGGVNVAGTIPSASTATSWTPTANVVGTGTYRVVPVVDNREGVAALFTLEVRAPLAGEHVSDLNYQNQDRVPAISLTGDLPTNTVVTWTAVDPDRIGISAGGTGSIPAFTAVNTGTSNVTATINYTVAYADGKGCSVTGSFTITVAPKTNVDSDLIAETDAASEVACLGAVFQTINFSATDKISHTGDIEYRIEFVSGVNVAGTVPSASTATSWTPIANVVGTGIYRVVPVVNNREGVAALFTLESRASLAGNHISDLVYENKDQVPTINLTGNLPTNTIVTWTANDPGKIGISASGAGVIPAFTAVNTGTSNVSATINYTVAYADGKGCSVTGSFTITVTPKTNVDSDLIAETDADAGEITCLGDVFTPINFSVTDKKGHTGNVEYRIEFVSGVNVAGTIPSASTAASWTPTANVVGTGTYRVVPVVDNREGVAAVFTLEVRTPLTANHISDLTYQNRDQVPNINLTANLPANTVVTWTADNLNMGISAGGSGHIPAFSAVNTGTSPVTATINYTVAYADGKGCSDTNSFTITVLPKTIDDLDLVANATVTTGLVCLGDPFAFNLSTTHFGNPVSPVSYKVELVSGTDILPVGTSFINGANQLTADKIGSGIYRVTPVYQDKMGVPAIITLEARTKVTITQLNLTYQNGDLAPAIDLVNSNPNLTVTWQAIDPSRIGVDAQGVGTIPAFRAINTGASPVIATIQYTIAYVDGQGCNATGSFTITVTPKNIEDMDLIASANVSVGTVCEGYPISFNLLTRHQGNVVTPVDYRYEIISGVDILPAGITFVNGFNQFVTTKPGHAIYRITPVYNNKEGVPTSISVEARTILNANDYIKLNGKTFSYANGDQVPTITLTSNPLPVGAIVTWKSDNVGIGIAAAGDGEIPGFRAIYTNNANNTAVITYSISYPGSETCNSGPLSGSFTITVTPKTIEDLDLIATAAVTTGTACIGDPFAFTLAATYHGTPVTPTSYRVELINGTDILPVGSTFVHGSNHLLVADKVGTAIYRVIPIYNGRQGVPASVSLEARAKLTANQISDLTYQHGDYVPAIRLNNSLPANTVVTWTAINPNNIGISANGVGEIPAFKIANPGDIPVTATINYTIAYADGKGCAANGSFTITVLPETIQDLKATATVTTGTVCLGDPFVFNLATTYQGNAITPTFYHIEIISGIDILAPGYVLVDGDNQVFADKTGSGIYRITPVYNNQQGMPATVSLEARASLAGNHISDLTFQNGDPVPAISLTSNLPTNAVVTWTADDPSQIGISAQGISIIPAFTATNSSTGNVTATVNYTVAYTDGKACQASGSFTITVTPRTNVDLDLVAHTDANAGEIICLGETFSPVTFSATDKKNHTGQIEYRIELVSGVNVAGTLPPTSTSTTWTPQANVVGSGIYRVIPSVDNREGVAALFTLEVRPPLVENQTSNLTYQNGDRVANISLTNNLPANTVVTWTVTDPAHIGIPAQGTGDIPAFTAVNTGTSNVTATVNYTIAYLDGKGCTTTGSFTVTVVPKTNVDLDLVAITDADASEIICLGETFSPVTFSATDKASHTGQIEYRIELVSGVNVAGTLPPTSTSTTWTPQANVVGSGIYRVVPTVDNREGVAALFTLEVRTPLTANHISDLTYQNSDPVPAISLTANLPANTVVTWTAVDPNKIGISASGSGSIPAFSAVNTGTGNVTATVNYSVAYTDGKACKASGSFTITVTPRTNVDLDLVAHTDADAGEIICLGETFSPVTFSATDKASHTGQIEYRIELVSGVNVAGTLPAASTATTWTPQANVVGSGIYRVVPIVDNREGVAALFTLEVRTPLTANHISDLTYQNSDQVPTISLTANLPANTVITWTAIDPNKIGISAGGSGAIPAFSAVNTGTSNVTATVNYTIAYLDGKGCTATGSFTITVTPRTNVDLDLVAQTDANAGEIICLGETFSPITFSATDKKSHTGQIEYRIELVSGVNVAGTIPAASTATTWTPQANVVGSGIYRVVPIVDNREGIAALFTLEVRTPLAGNHISDLTYQNSDQVPAIHLTSNLPANVVVTWTAIDPNKIGVSASGSGSIPAFSAVNTGTSNVTATVNYTIAYLDGKGCDATGSFTITVTPRTNVDLDLVAQTDANAGEIICLGETFSPITFSATDKKNHTGQIEYRIELVSGVNVAGTIPAASTATTWTPQANVVGSGIYRVVPIVDNREGVAALFTLEVRTPLTGTQISNLTYQNGDRVPAISLTSNLPANTVITWTAVDPNKTGVPAQGTGDIPAFTALNFGTSSVTATINYSIAFADGKGCAANGSFTIKVLPKALDEADFYIIPVENQTICYGNTFADIHLKAEFRFDAAFAEATDFRWELVDGTDILGLGTLGHIQSNDNTAVWTISVNPKQLVTGSAGYRITPYWNNNKGASTTFTLTRLPLSNTDKSEVIDLVYCGSETVVLDAELAGTAYQWYRNGNAIDGATHSTYTITSDFSGSYYAQVTTECGIYKSTVYNLITTPDLVAQRWDDVLALHTNPAENGGFEFVSYQWYSINNGEETQLFGENASYLYVPDGANTSATYFVKAVMKDGTIFQSCPVAFQPVLSSGITIYPNPVRKGELITVDITPNLFVPDQTLIQVLSISNGLISNVKASEAKSQVRMPNTAGVYILRVQTGGISKSFKIIIE
ncbi:hypothetical protein FACS189440_02410 [Bacteroidia bacterium]|nr:hypothetical protein FACS189423_01900 [Bacteroidia bacterium]GHT45766.1 hypothetical protein FACS189440_02410 [Bacteroidia bacterium]